VRRRRQRGRAKWQLRPKKRSLKSVDVATEDESDVLVEMSHL